IQEIAIITRSAPARTLGLSKTTGFKVGNPANLVIYNLDIEKLDCSKDYIRVIKGFSSSDLTIKNGKIIIKNGVITNEIYGCTYFNGEKKEDYDINTMIEKYFSQYYTIERENFILTEEDAPNAKILR
ncbi:MAG: hypothetical protein ACTSYQ_00775, partial [Candidatus Odinarchaeia archaeon]